MTAKKLTVVKKFAADKERHQAAHEKHREEQEQSAASLSFDDALKILQAWLNRLEELAEEAAINLPYTLSDVHRGLSDVHRGWSTRLELYDWVDELQPWQKKIHQRCAQIVAAAGDVEGAEYDPKLCEIEDDYLNLRMWMEDTAFRLGVIAGAKLAGYSSEKLNRLAEIAAQEIA